MINSYTFYCLQRLGLIAHIPEDYNLDPEYFMFSMAIKMNDMEYIISDDGICEETLDSSEILFLSLSMHRILSNPMLSKAAAYIRDVIEEKTGELVQVHLDGDDSMIILKFNSIDKELASFYSVPYNQNSVQTYNTLRPDNKKGLGKDTKYQSPTLEVHRKEFLNIGLEEIGINVLYV